MNKFKHLSFNLTRPLSAFSSSIRQLGVKLNLVANTHSPLKEC